MNNKLNMQFETCKKLLSADGLKKGKNWKGAEVYIPVYNKEYVGGFPKIVIVKDNVMRISSSDECFAYMKEIK